MLKTVAKKSKVNKNKFLLYCAESAFISLQHTLFSD